jgi:hypothetical protein
MKLSKEPNTRVPHSSSQLSTNRLYFPRHHFACSFYGKKSILRHLVGRSKLQFTIQAIFRKIIKIRLPPKSNEIRGT